MGQKPDQPVASVLSVDLGLDTQTFDDDLLNKGCHTISLAMVLMPCLAR